MHSKLINDTRWSLTYHLLERYNGIEHHMQILEVYELEYFRLKDTDLDDIKALCNKFWELDSVTIFLQNCLTTLTDARTLFDAVIDKRALMHVRLGYRAGIKENPYFESACTKVQNKKEAILTSAEQLALRKIQDNNPNTNQRNERKESGSLAMQALK